MAHRTVHVGNVGSNISERGLLAVFSSFGEVTNIKLAGDPSYPSRFAFVEFADPSNAKSACRLTGSDVGGKPVKVMIAKKAITTPFIYGSRGNAHPQQQTTASDPTPRTVYVSGIDTTLLDSQILEFFSTSGQVTNHRFCGDSNLPQRFAFVEFADVNMAQAAVNMSGSVLGKYPVRILASKSAIQNTVSRGNYSNEQLDMITRTIHVGNLDIGIGEPYIREMFENASGPIARVAIAGETSYATRFAFIEFTHKESAQDALKMNGVIVAGKQIRVNLSRSPIMINNHQEDQSSHTYSHYVDKHNGHEHDSRPYKSSSQEEQIQSTPIPSITPAQTHIVQPQPSPQVDEQKKKNDLSPARENREGEEESDEEDSDSGSEDSSEDDSDSEEDESEEEEDEQARKRRKKQGNGPDKKKIKSN
ncbi:polyadenylate-binding protein-interacting protein [Acrasis kona]|uniref:Polyadenylate-binding protein-interacting protein n=1 Tax=Acrasis kona TaxID=1008807 RepID=A0AAW2Z0D7_9EUKA